MTSEQAAVRQPVSASPYLNVRGASEALDFYERAFGAREKYRLIDPADGRIGHCEFELGGMVFMMSDEYPDFGAVSPVALGGSPVKFHLTVINIDEFVARAVDGGATELRAVKAEFHGHRNGVLVDPFGFSWHISEPMEDLSTEEMQRRWNEFVNS